MASFKVTSLAFIAVAITFCSAEVSYFTLQVRFLDLNIY